MSAAFLKLVMKMNKKYTICSTGNNETLIYLNGYFPENQIEFMIPGVAGLDDFFAFFDEKWAKVVLVNKSNVIWIKEND